MVRPHVVRDFQIGNTRIKIADNYCRDKTAYDVEWILKSIAEQAQRQFNAAATAGKYGQEKNSYISADNRQPDSGSCVLCGSGRADKR